jgi:hypothetical protein
MSPGERETGVWQRLIQQTEPPSRTTWSVMPRAHRSSSFTGSPKALRRGIRSSSDSHLGTKSSRSICAGTDDPRRPTNTDSMR